MGCASSLSLSLLSLGECFLLCASKCAIWTRASSITSRWTSCPWTQNATGVCMCILNKPISLYTCWFIYSHAYTPAGTCTTARSGWWPETRTTPASLPGSTCTRTRRAQERRGCVRSSALTGSNSPTTRWTIRDM